MKIVYKAVAWIGNPASILDTNFSNPKEVAGIVSLIPPDLEMESCGYVRLGEAEVSIDGSSVDRLYEEAVAAVREKIRQRDAEHENSRNALLNLISKFESLEYKA